MRLCYLDESGDTSGLPSSTSPITPVFSIAGLIIPDFKLRPITEEFLQLKGKFFPGKFAPASRGLDWILTEIKGADVRRDVRSNRRRERTHAIGFLDHSLRLLEQHKALIIGRVWIKGIGTEMNSRSIYTSSVQAICGYFQQYLLSVNDYGLVIADSRNKTLNVQTSHSIFTQKFKNSGDEYSRILEMPTFGHSDNHVGLQLGDMIVSGFLFPMAVYSYSYPLINNVHTNPLFGEINRRFGARIKALQYRYADPEGRWRGGVTVSDGLSQSTGARLFKDPHGPSA